MTEKRFEMKKGYYTEHIIENNHPKIPQMFVSTQEVVDRLNELYEENEQLKKSYTELRHKHSLLHDICIEAECDRDGYQKDILSLEKENKQLKQQIHYFEGVEWLRDNTVWEQMPTSKRTFTKTGDKND